MPGFVLAESGHVVQALAPVDITGGANSRGVLLRNWAHASIIVGIGASAAAPTSIKVQACSNATGTGATDVGFSYYAELAAGADTDVLGARVTVAATGITSVDADDGVFYVIEIDAREVPASLPYIRVAIAAPASAIIAHVTFILSGGRFQQVSSPTETA